MHNQAASLILHIFSEGIYLKHCLFGVLCASTGVHSHGFARLLSKRSLTIFSRVGPGFYAGCRMRHSLKASCQLEAMRCSPQCEFAVDSVISSSAGG